ncbi:hypothetical protein MACJ_002536 [Theileria orientalis]|uniref:Uncharacterized protein n=1 Tax=Theileria orientalis TaxID=68886 RepID=A0A976M6D2_THEOR|nr:hypothetical protein MACJ_002536 [Theileria orientalis]
MNKFWLALLLVLLLASILTVGLTFTFLYKVKKGTKDVKHNEIIWSFHLESDDSKLKGTIEDIINVDILKTIEYEVGGNKAALRSVVHHFGELTLTGWIHSFKYPLRIKKILVEKAEIKVEKLVSISGFTVFSKEGNADFVTLWHDDAFHHYSTSGELLSIGAFPFAKGDDSKHPNILDLPKELAEAADLAHPKIPEDVPKAHEEIIPKAHEEIIPKEETIPKKEEKIPKKEEKIPKKEEKIPKKEEKIPKKEEKIPKEEKVDEKIEVIDLDHSAPKTDRREGALVIDLDMASKSQLGAPFTYSDGTDEITITRTTFNVSYEKWTFTLTTPRPVVPYLKYEGALVDVGCSDVVEMAVFVGKVNLPLLANFREIGKITSFAHRGRSEWELVSATVVDVDTLDDIYCFLNELVIFDFSKQSGMYKVGGFEVIVTETVGEEPFEKFKSFKHTIYRTNKNGLQSAAAKVHKYKFFKVNFNGLNSNDAVTTATAFFWDGDLTKALMIRLLVGTTFFNYVGYKDYELEPKASLLLGRLESLNYQVNRVLTINLTKMAPYDFKGGVLGTREEHVAVRIVDNDPMEHFRKCVHTHAASRNLEHFKILGFLGEDYLSFEQRDVSLVEAYFLKGHLDKPLLFSLKGHFHTHHYFLEGARFVKKDLIFEDIVYTLKHLAYHRFTYLTLDFNKFSAYHFSGESAFPRHRHAHVVVRRNDEPDEFVRTTHTLEKVLGERTNFYVLALEGADIKLEDQVVTSVDAYFVKRHLDEPIAILFKGAANRFFVATKTGFEQKDSGLLSNLKKTLRHAAHDKLKMVYLQLHRTSNYYDEHLDGLEVKVEDRTVDLEIDGFKKFVHTFPESTDVRFLLFESYFDPNVDPILDLVKAVVITGRKDFPVLVSLIDVEGNAFYFKYDGDSKWAKIKPIEMNKFLMTVNEQLVDGEFHETEAPKYHLSSIYPF